MLDIEAERELFGNHPVFVFDPDDTSNRTIPGVHDNALIFWPRFPSFLRRLFTTAFTVGLHDPGARITEGAWRRAMYRLRDSVLNCARCGVDVCYDEEFDRAGCWSCGSDLTLPPRLDFGGGVVVFLTRGAAVTEHHVDRSFDRTPVADVTTHPQDQNVLGLRNLTRSPWRVRVGNGPYTVIAPQRSIAVIEGLEIQFTHQRSAHVVFTAQSLAES
ncbi:MAG: hypothetical protein WKF82_10015 [Nocardioidaceae bacterium]